MLKADKDLVEDYHELPPDDDMDLVTEGKARYSKHVLRLEFALDDKDGGGMSGMMKHVARGYFLRALGGRLLARYHGCIDILFSDDNAKTWVVRIRLVIPASVEGG